MHNKFMAVLLIGASLLGLNGCATTGSYAVSGTDYEQFYDTNGIRRLVNRNNDVWIEKLDGSEKRQITHTPNIREDEAYFVLGSSHIVYGKLNYAQPYLSKVYLVPVDKDDNARKEISMSEATSLVNSSRK